MLAEIDLKTARGVAVKSVEDGAKAAKEIGYPVMTRVAYALGGKGSGVARDEKELRESLKQAFTCAPQILIEEYLGGWKEIEYKAYGIEFPSVKDRMDQLEESIQIILTFS